MNEKVLKFRPHLVPFIMDGSKNVTWRLFDDKDLQTGDALVLRNWETGEDFTKAQVTAVLEKSLREITEADMLGHEKFTDRDDMLSHYQEYYGEKVNWDTKVKMIKFSLL